MIRNRPSIGCIWPGTRILVWRWIRWRWPSTMIWKPLIYEQSEQNLFNFSEDFHEKIIFWTSIGKGLPPNPSSWKPSTGRIIDVEFTSQSTCFGQFSDWKINVDFIFKNARPFRRDFSLIPTPVWFQIDLEILVMDVKSTLRTREKSTLMYNQFEVWFLWRRTFDPFPTLTFCYKLSNRREIEVESVQSIIILEDDEFLTSFRLLRFMMRRLTDEESTSKYSWFKV